jgi:hypothetical protein
MQGLHDDPRDLAAMGHEDFGGRAEIVVWRYQHVVHGARRHAGRGGLALGKCEKASREEADGADLVGAVVRALEFQHARAARKGAGQANGVRGGFGARGAEAQPLGARNRARQLLGQLERGVGDVREVRAELDAASDRLDDRRVSVAEDHGSPAHREVGELAAVGVPDGGAPAAREYDRELTRQVVLAGRARWEDRPRTVGGGGHDGASATRARRRSGVAAIPEASAVSANDLALTLLHPLSAPLAVMHPLSAGGGGRHGDASERLGGARARLHAAGTLPRMADDWQDLEFLRHVFDETQVVRKPLTGIITGYHVLPYILVGPEHDHPGRSVEVRGRIKVSPRLVIGAGSGPTYGEMFNETELMDQRLIARVFSFRYASRVALESEELRIRRQERDAHGHIERVLEELSQREVVNTGVIATPDVRFYPVSIDRFIREILDQEFRE